jgi:hypothetical protein
MQQANVVRRFLLPPHENAAVAVQPRVNPLDDPAACAISAAALHLLFAARADVWRVASATGRATNSVGIVALVAAEMLLAPAAGPWAWHRNAIERGVDESLIMHIGAGHRQANRHAASVGEHRPLHAQFAAIGRVFPGFFPHPAAPWFAPRLSFAIATRCRAGHHSVSIATSTIGEEHPVPSTLGSTDGSCCPIRSISAQPSTGNRCAIRNRCRSSPAASLPAAVRQADNSGTWATAAECAAKTHPTSTNYNHETLSSRKNPPCEVEIPSHGIHYVFSRSLVLG